MAEQADAAKVGPIRAQVVIEKHEGDAPPFTETLTQWQEDGQVVTDPARVAALEQQLQEAHDCG